MGGKKYVDVYIFYNADLGILEVSEIVHESCLGNYEDLIYIGAFADSTNRIGDSGIRIHSDSDFSNRRRGCFGEWNQ